MEHSGKKIIKVAVHQPGYHRYCGYFYKMLISDVFISLDTVQFVRREWQSRQRFYYQGKYKWLTVPIEKGRDIIANKKIANPKVLKDHWEYIKFVYRKTPYFSNYAPHIENIYRRRWVYLNDLCVELILLAKSILSIKTKFIKDSEFWNSNQKGLKKADLLIYCIKKFIKVDSHRKIIYLPRAAPIPEDFYLNQRFNGCPYTEIEKFKVAGIKVEAYNFNHPVYRQYQNSQEEIFVANLSVFDLIFNCGEASLGILKKGEKTNGSTNQQT